MIMTKKRCEVKQAAVMGHNSLLRTINHFVQQMATDTTNPLQIIQNYLLHFEWCILHIELSSKLLSQLC